MRENAEQLQAAWWTRWWNANWCWTALAGKPVGGNLDVIHGGADGEQSLQTYWRRDPATGVSRDDAAMQAAGELLEGPDGATWHLVHAPLHWRDGTPAKANWDGVLRARLAGLVAARLAAAGATRTDAMLNAEGPDLRAQLSGAVLLDAPRPPVGGAALHLVCDGAALPGWIASGLAFGPGLRCDGASFLAGALFDHASFSGPASFGGAVFSAHAGFQGATFAAGAGFAGATFVEGVNFDGTAFSSDASFQGATLAGASFVGAGIAGPAGFRGASFPGGVSFQNATLAGGSNFSGATFSACAGFQRATFSGATSFGGATFVGAVGFERASFPGHAEFSSAAFGNAAYFDGAGFGAGASFYRASFAGHARFYCASFSGRCSFEGASFAEFAEFRLTTFAGASFSGASFAANAAFDSATFGQDADFTAGEFAATASFTGARFDPARNEADRAPLANFTGRRFAGIAHFTRAEFHRRAAFQGTIFERLARFDGITFPATPALWQAMFSQTQFQGVASFRGAGCQCFAAFDGAAFGGGLQWDDPGEAAAKRRFHEELAQAQQARPPSPPPTLKMMAVQVGGILEVAPETGREAALRHLERGCRVLKQAMEQGSDKTREQIFYAFELTARRHQRDTPGWERFFSRAYAATGDYGRSIGRPLLCLFASIPLFALFYWLLLRTAGPPGGGAPIYQALTVSLGRVFPFGLWQVTGPEFQQGVLGLGDTARSLAIRGLATLQSLLAIIFVFLAGLALRRRFQLS